MFKMTFLGTSAGMPTKHRNVTALAIECQRSQQAKSNHNKTKSPWVLIDCGEGTQHQILHTPLSGHQLAAICITHVHGDHCYGLPGLLASMAMAGRKHDLIIIAPQAIETMIKAIARTSELTLPYLIRFIAIEALDEKTNDEIEIQKSLNKNDKFKGLSTQDTDSLDFAVTVDKQGDVTLSFSNTHKLTISATPLAHRVPSYAFTMVQKHSTIKLDTDKLDVNNVPPSSVWGLLQRGNDVVLEDGRQLLSADYTERLTQSLKIIIGGDNADPTLLQQTVQDASLLVHEATYTQAIADSIAAREDSYDPMHTTAKGIADFAHRQKVPNLILTHFSARYQSFDDPESKISNMADIRQEGQHYYNGNLWLAKDFDQFKVTADGKVHKLNLD